MASTPYNEHFKEFLASAQKQILAENIEGYKVNTYCSSFSLAKRVKGVDEELTIRSIGNAKLRAEHSKIKRTPLGQKVKSNHIDGNVETCVAFIKTQMALHQTA